MVWTRAFMNAISQARYRMRCLDRITKRRRIIGLSPPTRTRDADIDIAAPESGARGTQPLTALAGSDRCADSSQRMS
jgi:hypothetical protein